MTTFDERLRELYSFTAPSIEIGHATREGAVHPELGVKIPLAMMNRHGLIAGSTGTGKTRTLQLLVEGLSRNGVPTFVSDVKGDLSGLATGGESSTRVVDRMASVGRQFVPESFPVEFYSLTGNRGTQVRATVSSFGPILLGKVLDLTDTQQSVLAMVFKYCDDRGLPLLDFKDLRDVLHYLGEEGKAELKDYGGMSAATVGVLIRKMVELEQQGADRFFGEPELDLKDLIRTAADGKGIVNVLSLADVQDKPRLYSTFLMWLLGQFYYDLPEVGDPEKPKLVFFFDEAHLLFEDASSALVEQIQQIARLIRSKGIGVFFITQTPGDVDEGVLSQLANRVQHAVRAFTARDAKNLKAAASTFPPSDFYDIDDTLKSLGTGEALVAVLSPKGVPTDAAAVQIMAPSSSMSPLGEPEYNRILSVSAIRVKYLTAVDRDSAHEMLKRKLAASAEVAAKEAEHERWMEESKERERAEARESAASRPSSRTSSGRQKKGVVQSVVENAARQAARTLTQQVVRGIFGMLRR